MSAIAGVLCLSGDCSSREPIAKVMEALRKYPADDARIWMHPSSPLSLGCHALWTTTESVGEALPRYTESDGLAITADVILDNREELFEQLRIASCDRKGMTDSELIIAAYKKWGDSSPKYLMGDFAFVIWDEKRRELFGARDLLGRRTLYYVQTPDRFAFCTVIQPLLAIPGIRKELQEDWFAEFLAIPMMLDAIDVRATAYRGIWQLPPAHSLTVKNGSVTIKEYDKIATPKRKLKLKSDAEYEEAFREVFDRAVRSKLRTRLQVGIRLSGGLDSGVVAGFAANPLRQESKKLHAYSFVPSEGYTDWTPKRLIANERPYIEETARYIGNIEEHYMSFEGRNAISEIDSVLDMVEGPYKFFENAFWLTGMLEQAKRHGVGVMLNGSRGNYTVSWGDPIDHYTRLLRTFRWLRAYRQLNGYVQVMQTGKSVILPIMARQAYAYWMRSSLRKKQSDIPLLIHPDFAARTKVIERLMDADVGLTAYSPDEISARNDQFERLSVSNHIGTAAAKMSLPYGIVERDPTGDPRVIRFCLSVPDEQFVQGGVDRSLVRRAAKDRLPDIVRMNIRQRGVQGADWIYRLLPQWKSIREELDALCADTLASQYLNVPQIKISLRKLGEQPKLEYAFDLDARIAIRSLIAYRFLRRWA